MSHGHSRPESRNLCLVFICSTTVVSVLLWRDVVKDEIFFTLSAQNRMYAVPRDGDYPVEELGTAI